MLLNYHFIKLSIQLSMKWIDNEWNYLFHWLWFVWPKSFLQSEKSFFIYCSWRMANLSVIPNCCSCIDLIFTNQPSLVDSNCYHQIIHCKRKLKIEYHPTYQWAFWSFKKARCGSTKNYLSIFTIFAPKKKVKIDETGLLWMTEKTKQKT